MVNINMVRLNFVPGSSESIGLLEALDDLENNSTIYEAKFIQSFEKGTVSHPISVPM